MQQSTSESPKREPSGLLSYLDLHIACGNAPGEDRGMAFSNDRPSTGPVFKKCARCDYSLRGLPTKHACPECGLRFDERCELYRVTNPKKILAVWILIITGGWSVLRQLPHIAHFAAASLWQQIGALAAVVWFFFVGLFIWHMVKRYRRGFAVAVTADGLIVRLPGFNDDLIPWASIGGASVKKTRTGKPQVASIQFIERKRNIDIGGVNNVFPTRGDVERFVNQVNERTAK